MPEQDITLGEVYRAVLSLREDVQQTRTDIQVGQQALRDEVNKGALTMAEHAVKIDHINDRVMALETIKLNSVETRVKTLETAPPASADPLARWIAALGTALLAAITYWLNKGG